MRLCATLIVGVLAVVAVCLVANRNAEREYAAYRELERNGATGDDWVGLSEFITGRPPVVSLYIPKNVPREVVFRCVPKMCNLESLSISYDSLSASELAALAQLPLNSLRFTGEFPCNDTIGSLAGFTHLRHLYLPSVVTCRQAVAKLEAALPQTRIEVEVPSGDGV